MTAGALVTRLRGELLDRFGTVIPAGGRVALLDFPNHPNVGDTAIWLGELAALRAIGVEVAYAASFSSYSPAVLHRRLGRGGTVLLHGGGNFGDVWPTYQRFRERVLGEQASRRVVQLPQSIHFQSEAAARQAARVFEAHPDSVLMVRDEASDRFAREHFGSSHIVAAPDAAFALGPVSGPPPDLDALVLLRTDHESRHRPAAELPGGVLAADWPPADSWSRGLKTASKGLGYPLKRAGRWFGWLDPAVDRMFGQLARRRLAGGLDLIARGRVVVTDRLHGHILCLLLGRPHVMLDNSYGKNRRFFDRWTVESPITRWADDLDGALALTGIRPS